MSKRFLIILAALVVIFAGVIIINDHSSNNNSSNAATVSHHVEGKGSTGVKLVEYGDYQCPYCAEYYPIVKQVVQQYSDQITFQFVNFPLTEDHPNAFSAARAAEAASLQGKFWQMHDLLYMSSDAYVQNGETGNYWDSSSNPLSFYDQYAKQLGLNLTKFNKDYNSNEVNNIIEGDMNKGNKLNVDATPTFYLDGKQISPSETVSSFQKYIAAAIAQKQKS